MALLAGLFSCGGSRPHSADRPIVSGVAWFDEQGREVNAHGACIVQDGGRFYLFGEYHSDTTNAFGGFGCYSSPDLADWTFEGIVLPVQREGLLGPRRVGERVKVMKCPSTGEYVMFMHTDDMGYNDPHVGYATCETIDGEYEFKGELLYEGKYIHKWDLGTFQDSDGKGYLLTHSGFIYELAPDYKSVARIAAHVELDGESPAMFKSGGTYYWLFSHRTSWERNDNFYLTAPCIEGPWRHRGLFAPEGSLTWNSQCSFVLPVAGPADTLLLYMGDRWSYPRQGSAATYVWQPVTVAGDSMSIPRMQTAWRAEPRSGGWQPVELQTRSVADGYRIESEGWQAGEAGFSSAQRGAVLAFPFRGRCVGLTATSNPMSGYARVTVCDAAGEELLRTTVDFYSKYEYTSLKFLSPQWEEGDYVLRVEPLGEHPKWSDKRFSDYGSKADSVIVRDVFTVERFN